MDAVKYRFADFVHISGSKYIFQSITRRKLSDICHSHDFYELCLLLKGTALHRINHAELSMTSGDCVILTPRDVHCFVSQSEDLELIALSVHSDEFISIANVFSIDLTSAEDVELFSCTERLEAFQNQSVHCCCGIEDNENKLLLAMLLSIYAASRKSRQSEVPSSLAYAVSMMGEHLKEGLPALIRLTNYSYPHLYRLIKQHYGMTPHDLILRRKLDAAYSRLIHSDISVEQIAESVGFCSTSHFIKAFREHYGASPAKLRREKKSTCF